MRETHIKEGLKLPITENMSLEEDVRKELESILQSTQMLVKKIVSKYSSRISELQTRCETLEQENIELKYKLRQLGNDLRNLSEKITSGLIKEADIDTKPEEQE